MTIITNTREHVSEETFSHMEVYANRLLELLSTSPAIFEAAQALFDSVTRPDSGASGSWERFEVAAPDLILLAKLRDLVWSGHSKNKSRVYWISDSSIPQDTKFDSYQQQIGYGMPLTLTANGLNIVRLSVKYADPSNPQVAAAAVKDSSSLELIWMNGAFMRRLSVEYNENDIRAHLTDDKTQLSVSMDLSYRARRKWSIGVVSLELREVVAPTFQPCADLLKQVRNLFGDPACAASLAMQELVSESGKAERSAEVLKRNAEVVLQELTRLVKIAKDCSFPQYPNVPAHRVYRIGENTGGGGRNTVEVALGHADNALYYKRLSLYFPLSTQKTQGVWVTFNFSRETMRVYYNRTGTDIFDSSPAGEIFLPLVF